MTRKLALTVLTATTLFATAASAQRPIRRVSKRLPATSATMRAHMEVQRRLGRQLQQIHAGQLDGSLTWGESKRVLSGAESIDLRLQAALSDRRITRREQARLRTLLDRNERRIVAFRSNGRSRLLGPVPVVQRPNRLPVPGPRTLPAPKRHVTRGLPI